MTERAEQLTDDVIDVSIIVVTWNSEKWIGSCLDALEPGCEGLRWEVIVHDNASTDLSADETQAHAGENTVLSRGLANHGFACGINTAAALARGRLLLLLNPDCVVSPGSISILVNHLDEHLDIAASVPLLIGEDGLSQREFQFRRLPNIASIAAELLLLDHIVPDNRITAAHRCRDLDITQVVGIEQPAAAAMMIRREVFESLGGFDQSFAPAWFEDVDFCHRMKTSGDPINLVPAARFTHLGGSSLESMTWAEFVEAWSRNLWRYGEKWFDPEDREKLRILVIAGMLLRAAAVGIGISKPRDGRLADCAAYVKVVRSAFNRWAVSSQSS